MYFYLEERITERKADLPSAISCPSWPQLRLGQAEARWLETPLGVPAQVQGPQRVGHLPLLSQARW